MQLDLKNVLFVVVILGTKLASLMYELLPAHLFSSDRFFWVYINIIRMSRIFQNQFTKLLQRISCYMWLVAGMCPIYPGLWIITGRRFEPVFYLGTGANKWKSKWKFKMAFAIRRRPPPLMAQISRHFFTPLFFFCNWILHIWNGFYTSKISLLSPLIIGSKLTFISISVRWLPTI